LFKALVQEVKQAELGAAEALEQQLVAITYPIGPAVFVPPIVLGPSTGKENVMLALASAVVAVGAARLLFFVHGFLGL
jgi:hypothetical protein